MEFNENKPIYLQIADSIMDDIASGANPEAGRLESVRDYASRIGVNANTVMRAYTWLQERELIYNKRGIGYFVAGDAGERSRQLIRQSFFDKEAPYFFRRISGFGITPEELSSIYSKFLDETK